MSEKNIYSESFTVEELQQMRAKLAKRANQRIRVLKRNISPITGESYSEWGASKNALDELKRRGKRYFSEAMGKTTNKKRLKAEILELQRFLNSKSSTLSGARRIEAQRQATFEAKGIHFSDTKEFYDFLNSETFESIVSSGIQSNKIVEAYDMAREKMSESEVTEKMQNALEEFRKKKKTNLKMIYSELGINPLKDSKNVKR